MQREASCFCLSLLGFGIKEFLNGSACAGALSQLQVYYVESCASIVRPHWRPHPVIIQFRKYSEQDILLCGKHRRWGLV